MTYRFACNNLLRNLHKLEEISACPKLKTQKPLLISCKRKDLNCYIDTNYEKWAEIPLASKGWNHSKSKNDYFTIHPVDDVEKAEFPFEELEIDQRIIEVIKSYGINFATDFQSRAISEIQLGSHTVLAAETGCGKTLGYLLPIIQRLLNQERSNNLNTPLAVIAVPNRELAYQIADLAKSLCEAVGLNSHILVGGQTIKLMKNPIFLEVDILVATPGALSKLSAVGVYKLNEVQTLVLDEADTLLDDSFLDRIEILVKRMSQAQLVLVSATLPRKLPDVLAPYDATMKHVISSKLHKPLLNITQKFMRITRSTKPANLLQIAKINKSPMLIFTNRNETCKWLAQFLRENSIPCSNISGDMNFEIRINQWNQFVRGETKVLAATDVGSRGLNTIQVKHVLNYDFPLYIADYIHRIGRVGRLGSSEKCMVTNFITSLPEIKLLQEIELAIRRNEPFSNVDGNITNILQKKILRRIRESSQ